MTTNSKAFDAWIRDSFCDINTTLENYYFELPNPAEVKDEGLDHKTQLLDEGHAHIQALLAEGNTDEGFDAGFDLLGNVGLFLGACRRHELFDSPHFEQTPLTVAASLALQLGASLGVTPRFATSHLTTHNRAIAGRYKTFTHLEAEACFLDYNTRGILAYKRAADAVTRTLPLGISHPITSELLVTAKQALDDVARHNKALFAELDVGRFFYCVRPYYKPYQVGLKEYRGANAGDFSGINELDLLLGLCQPEDPSYGQLLVDKFLFMMPEDQQRLRDCMRRDSLLKQLQRAAEEQPHPDWFKPTLAAFIELCDAHAVAAQQHHDQLVQRFIVGPSANLPQENLNHITASGPPLEVLLVALEKLRDRRSATDREDIDALRELLAS